MDKEFKGDDPALIALWRLGVELEYKVGWANAVWFARANDKIPPYADETYRVTMKPNQKRQEIQSSGLNITRETDDTE